MKFSFFVIVLVGTFASFNESRFFSRKSGYLFTKIAPPRIFSFAIGSVRDFNTALYDPPKYIVDVFSDKSNFKNGEDKRQRWTISDVAVRAGIDINTAKMDLMNLAHITEAVLEVTDDGEILFSFPPNWKSLLFQRSFARRVKLRYEEVSPVLSAGFRATFGIILITSIVFITIVLSSASTSSSENDNNKSSSNGGNIGLQLNLHDIMQSQNQHRDSSKMSFLDSCYSYLFGDADPNEGMTSRQDKMISSIIRSNNGVVIAEQLAPFLPQPPVCKLGDDESAVGRTAVVDESWVLPVVMKYDGKPVVTADGHIVYQFENLLKTADTMDSRTECKGLNAVTSLNEKDFFEEQKKFSVADPNMLTTAAGLGVLNLGGAFMLGRLSMDVVTMSTAILIKRFYPAVLAYAVLYNAIPLVRSFLVKIENNEIDKRNSERRKWISFARNPNSELQQKIAAMKKLEMEPQRIDESKIIYSSENKND